ncbi:MAG: type 4a pilus biogenesis protein PilO [Candidatus Omnitrophota bacterium]
MEIREKQKIYVLFGIFGVVGLVIYFNLLLRPLSSGFFSKNRDFCVLKARVRSAQALISNEAGIKRQYENMMKESEYLKKRLPGQDQVPNLLEDFSNVAESSGVKILRLKPLEDMTVGTQPKNDNSIYAEFPILIEARAGYHQIGDFVDKLEKMERFIRIVDMDIKGMEQDPRHHEIKMRIITYVLRK